METKYNLQDATVSQLKELISANANCAKVFHDAAELSEKPHLTSLFTDIAAARHKNADELQLALQLTGEIEPVETTLTAPIQSWMMKARDMIQKDEEVGLLSELERSEDRILDAYKDVLKETAGSPLTAKLNEQVAAVKGQHDRIRDLRDAAKARA